AAMTGGLDHEGLPSMSSDYHRQTRASKRPSTASGTPSKRALPRIVAPSAKPTVSKATQPRAPSVSGGPESHSGRGIFAGGRLKWKLALAGMGAPVVGVRAPRPK